MEKNKMSLKPIKNNNQVDIEDFINQAELKTKSAPREKTINLKVNQEEFDALGKRAKQRGLSRNKFLLSIILPEIQDII